MMALTLGMALAWNLNRKRKKDPEIGNKDQDFSILKNMLNYSKLNLITIKIEFEFLIERECGITKLDTYLKC